MEKVVLSDKKFRLSISAGEIDEAIDNMAGRIDHDLRNHQPIFIAVLNGSFMFASDLIKKIRLTCRISFVKLASYEGDVSTGDPSEVIGLQEDLAGEHVVVLEDIVDTGRTLSVFLERIRETKPASLRIASLLYKPDACRYLRQPDYVGFEIPNRFVVGYGLDYKGLGRNLPGIYTEDEVFTN